MAQTKARNSSSSKSSTTSRKGSSRRSNGASAKASNRTKSNSSRSSNGSSSRASASRRKGKATTQSARSRKSTARRSPQSRNGSRSTLETIADKAKAPAMAGGAALVGLAGGMALAGRKKRRGVISRIKGSSMPKIDTSKLSMPKPDSALKAVGNAAGTVADRSHRLGQVATEVQKASDTLAKSKK